MEIDATRKNLNLNQLVNSKKETIIIEGDIIVPDVKPDILNTIDTSGNLCIYKKELLDNKAKFDGSIFLDIVYLADSEDDFVRNLNYSLDFNKTIDIEKCKSNMKLKNNFEIQNIECKILNGRKINVKVILNVDISIYSEEEVSILQQINNIENIQTLNSDVRINNLVGRGICKALAKDTISIEDGDELGEILKTEINIINKEEKVSYNKVLLKADINVKIMYLSEDKQIKVINSNIPLMGFIDITDVSENDILISNYEIKNILIKPNLNEQHLINVEIEFEISCDAMDEIEISLIQDMYSPTKNIIFDKKEVLAVSNIKKINKVCNIRNDISIPEISDNNIYDVEIMPNITSTNIFNGKIVYEGELKLNFLFSSNKSYAIDTKKFNLPFTFTIENDFINSNNMLKTNIRCIGDDFIIENERTIKIDINLEFETELYNDMNINIIDKINIADDSKNESHSFVIYIVKQGDQLWNIAKKYNNTVKNIMEINNIDNPKEIKTGQKLCIPRYCS